MAKTASASGSLLGVVVGVAAALALTGCADDSSSAPPAEATSSLRSSEPDTANETQPASPTTVDATYPGAFRDVDGPAGNVIMFGALADGSFVVVASETNASSPLPQSRFHRFVDAERWEEGAFLPYVPSDKGYQVEFSPAGGFFELTGSSDDSGQLEFVVTSSHDLTEFSTAALPTPDDPARPGVPMTDVRAELLAAGDSGVVVVGKGTSSDFPTGGSPVAWFSPDGGEFDLVDVSIFGPVPNGVNVVAFEHGFVALTQSEVVGTYRSYVSADGRSWTASDASNGVFENSQVRSVFAVGDRVVALGRSEGTWVSWTTDDGVAWTEHQLSASIPRLKDSRLTLEMAGAGPGGVFGLVTDPEADGPRPPEVTVVFSSDGETWRSIDRAAFGDADVEVEVSAAVALSGQALLYVWESTGDDHSYRPYGRWFLGDVSP